jgi:transmembrane sensor
MSRMSEQLMQAIREAAEWNQRLKAGGLDEAQRRECKQWMETSLHQEELGQMCLIDVLLRQAQIKLESPGRRPDNVIDFESYFPQLRPRTHDQVMPERRRRFGSKLKAAAAVVCLGLGVVIAGRAVSPVEESEVIATRVGAWDKKLTADGSVIYAGPVTDLTFRMDGKRRAVTFSRGEAFFDVAKDPAQPFVVITPHGTIRVVGTEFSVAYKGDSVVVTVVEGRVAVMPKRPDGSVQPTIALAANQQVVMSLSSVRGPATVDAERKVKWIRNWYEPHGEMVCEIIQQLNQRHDVEVVVDDAQVCRARMSSLRFKPSEPEDFVEKINRMYAEYPYRAGNPGSVLRLEHR